DAGVVAVGPDGVQPVGADQRDVGQLILAGTELGLRCEAPRETGLAAACCAWTGAAEDVERDPVHGSVGPFDQQRPRRLVVVETSWPGRLVRGKRYRRTVWSFMARPMSPLSLILPLMKAMVPSSLPVAMSTKSSDFMLIVMLGFSGAPSPTSAEPSLRAMW